MTTRRIFISSVMRDFTDVRAAAKEAVTSLRQIPVMAEDFGAQPFSSQVACLEGVRSSDVYLGIYGERYGFVAQSGMSATAEELQEARNRGLPILCFESAGAKEALQAEFLAKLKAYEEGYSFAFFTTTEDLKTKVVRALYDLIGHPGVAVLDASGAKAHADHHRWGRREAAYSGTWLGAVLFPARQGEPYLDILDLSRPEEQEKYLQPTLFGPGAIFRRELGVQNEEGEAHLGFYQGDRRQRSASLEIHTDGTLVFGMALGQSRGSRDNFSVTRMFLIDESEVRQALTTFASYAAQFYGLLTQGSVITSLYAGCSLTGLQSKSFGRIPANEPTSMSIAMKNIDDPLLVPREPLRVSRADLTDAAVIGQRWTDLFSRAFRTKGLYYGA
jgi:hypothetical protein